MPKKDHPKNSVDRRAERKYKRLLGMKLSSDARADLASIGLEFAMKRGLSKILKNAGIDLKKAEPILVDVGLFSLNLQEALKRTRHRRVS